MDFIISFFWEKILLVIDNYFGDYMRILVVSDVHTNIKVLKEILDKEKNIDLKIFLGDLQSSDKQIVENNFDFYVKGNSDFPNNWETLIITEIEKFKVLITHGHLFERLLKKIDFKIMYDYAKQNKIDLILHGHDHIKANETKNGIVRINPGSTTFPRDGEYGTYVILELNNKKIENIEYKRI